MCKAGKTSLCFQQDLVPLWEQQQEKGTRLAVLGILLIYLGANYTCLLGL